MVKKEKKEEITEEQEILSEVENQVRLTEGELEVEGDKEEKKEVKEAKTGKSNSQKNSRGSKYKLASQLVDKTKEYDLDEAIELVKKLSTTKFEGSIESHIALSVSKGKKKQDEALRTIVHFPHGTGKDVKVVVLNEELIEDIAKTKKADADVYLAKPDLMPKVGKIARVLGPKGKMPNPKVGTVTEDPEKIKKEIEEGRTEVKADANNVVHQMIGKTSWESQKIRENFEVLKTAMPKKQDSLDCSCSYYGTGCKGQNRYQEVKE